MCIRDRGKASTYDALQLAEEEKKKMADRAKRFGTTDPTDEEDKKRKRAERFGATSADSGSSSEDVKRKMERAKRFNLVTPETEKEKMKMRREKFGPVENIGQFPRKKFKATQEFCVISGTRESYPQLQQQITQQTNFLCATCKRL
eukprot:TRINITY_DN6241_c0_g1_i4.p1 TRINITY_DN6241_c0_g1~~TRINITY_DN6241_c0_g1_i4.p1  ORF type:complete len:166 (-),score=45.27 TRINITY_DN6241_c0_g1_i4:158-595(-)